MKKRKKITDLNVVSAKALVLEEVTYPHPSKLKSNMRSPDEPGNWKTKYFKDVCILSLNNQ